MFIKRFFRKNRVQRKEPILRIVFDAKKEFNEKGKIIYLRGITNKNKN